MKSRKIPVLTLKTRVAGMELVGNMSTALKVAEQATSPNDMDAALELAAPYGEAVTDARESLLKVRTLKRSRAHLEKILVLTWLPNHRGARDRSSFFVCVVWCAGAHGAVREGVRRDGGDAG